MQIDDVDIEIAEGYCLSILLTAETPYLREKIYRDFCAQSALPWGGIEAGVESFVSPLNTPDHQYGVVCSLWVSGRTETTLKKLQHSFIKRFRYALLPHLSIHIFNANSITEPKSPLIWMLPEEIVNFADGFETIESDWAREMVKIPRMGGDLFIESRFQIQEGFLGLNFWLYFENLKSACKSEEEMMQFFQMDGRSSGIAYIYGFAAGGSKIGSKKNFNTPVTTNDSFCPSLQPMKKNDVITEIVLNFYSFSDLERQINPIISYFQQFPHLIKISSGRYDGKIGSKRVNLPTILQKIFH